MPATSRKPEKSCCPMFEFALESRGNEGFAISLVDDECLGPHYFLEARAVEEGVDLDMSRWTRWTDGVPMIQLMVMEIHFCPWCGASLQDYFK